LNRSLILSFIALVVVIVATLSYIAISDSIFFYTVDLKTDNYVHELNEGYELYFYGYGDADSDRSFKIATVFYDIKQSDGDMAHIVFRLSSIDKFKIDALRLEVNMLSPAAALILENPQNGQGLPFDYERTDYDISVALDFPNLDSENSEAIDIDFWLDLALIEPGLKDNMTLDMSFSMHQESIFKIAKHNAHSAVELNFISSTQ